MAVLGAGAEMGPLAPLLRWGVRVAAVDLPWPAIWTRLLKTARRSAGQGPGTALAFLATPTDVFAVPGAAVRQSTLAYERRSRAAKVLGRPLRTLSGGRLLRRAYVRGSDPGISDSLVVQQGPNYALAKRL
ncbi:MAG: hypothetical protein QM650_02790 [Microlunatus sp.]